MSPAAPARPAAAPFAGLDFGLFAGTVIVWGTTWIAVKFQVGVVDPQVSVLWRFALAAPLMFLVCLVSGAPLRFPLRMHGRFAAYGAFGCCINFLLFYNSAQYVVSGLLAVIFALASVTNIILAVLLLGEPFRVRVALGALIGIAGVGLMFLPELEAAELGFAPLVGLAFGVLGCFSFSLANVISLPLRRAGIPATSINAWGLAYGVAFNAIAALAAGSSFIVEPSARYLLALLWLAVPGTVIAFWVYLTLLGRIGPDRAAYTTVLSPVLALLVSTLVEDYAWTWAAVFGLLLAAAGNILVLWPQKRA